LGAEISPPSHLVLDPITAHSRTHHRLREEKTASKDLNMKRSKKIIRRLDLMKQRYEALEKRRLLEAEGYKSSIKILRKRLSEVEQHIYRLASQWAGGGRCSLSFLELNFDA
jgi:hypothetical protein